MRSTRLRAASAAAVLLAVLLPALFLPAASAARSSATDRASWASWGAEFDRTVDGDFSTIGNTVTTCPPGGHARVCRKSEQGHADDGGLPALNNGNSMVWSDVDGDPDTYDSSRGQLSIPAGARIAFAKLTWAGDLRAGSLGRCGRGASWPSGSPERQAVSLTVGARPTMLITPGRFAIDEDSVAPLHAEDRWYSAHADVTADLAGVRGGEPSTVTVGNVWTGRGRDCFGGWSLVVVWTYDGSDAQHVPARKHVVVYDGHLRVPTGGTLLSLAAPGLRTSGSLTRIGVTAYEGDRALAGDALLVNGKVQREPSIPGERENFFVSNATGALDPRHVNNMSVDAKSFDVSSDAVRSGEDSDDPTVLSFTGTRDSYLVQSIAASFAKPELSVSTFTDRPATHAGERVTQTALVRNSGGAPASDVTVHLDIGAGCDRRIGTLGAGETASVACTGVAGDRDYGVTATATAAGAGGEKLSAWARRPVRVLHPALRAALRVLRDIVVPGESLDYVVVLHNDGDTTLSRISLHGNGLVACRRDDLDALPPAASRIVRCRAEAGQRGGSGTVTVSGQDELGRRVSDSASTSFTVVRPSITLDLIRPTVPVRPHGTATLTVRIRNTSPIPLNDVAVSGEPTGCDRNIGRLAPSEPFVYACQVHVEMDFQATLTASGVPVIGGRRIDALYSARASGSVRLTAQVPPKPPALRQQPPAIERPPAPLRPPEETAAAEKSTPMTPVAGIIAGLATTVMLVSVGAISRALRAK